MDNNTTEGTDYNLDRFLHKHKLDMVLLACANHTSIAETASALGINRNSLAVFLKTYTDYAKVTAKFKDNKKGVPKVEDVRKLQRSVAKADKLRMYIEALNKKRETDKALRAAEDEKLERLQRYRDKELREQAILAGQGVTLARGSNSGID